MGVMATGTSLKPEQFRLENGATIAVIGGGPAGSFFSILALKKAREKGLNLNVVLFDGKNFLSEGPRGCNMCAGVISKNLLLELEQLGLPIPEGRVQGVIDSYTFHTIKGSHSVHSPDGKGALPVVFRGNGPRFSGGIQNISFDDYLLSNAVQGGVRIVPSFVQSIEFQTGAAHRPVVRWRGGTLPADLVVAATGVSTEFAKKLESSGIRYRPPRCVRAFQAELDLGEGNVGKHFGNSIHVFSIGLKGIRFAAIIPKSRFATISLVGNRDLEKSHLSYFLSSPIVKSMLPSGWELPDRFCFCRPSLPIGCGKNFYSHRLMIVGDAAMSRHYKNGIDSAFRTARLAADAAFGDLTRGALKRSYGAPVAGEFKAENFYARILFALNDIVSPRDFWVNAHLYYVLRRPRSKTARTIFNLTWNLFTGQDSYRNIFLSSVSLRFLFWMAVGILGRRRFEDSAEGEKYPPGADQPDPSGNQGHTENNEVNL